MLLVNLRQVKLSLCDAIQWPQTKRERGVRKGGRANADLLLEKCKRKKWKNVKWFVRRMLQEFIVCLRLLAFRYERTRAYE